MPVEVSGVSVVFGDVVALRRVSFIAGDGQTVALMGPSGSGKSTLLGVIGGETQPTEGRVSFGLTARPSLEWIFQSSPMLDRRSALDNAALGAIARGYDVEAAFDSAARVLIDLGLGDRLGTAMFRLSGGERQRVAVARAIVSRPEVILADEPTASLDAGSRHLVMDALAAAATGGATVIIATHDSFVAAQCDRIIALDPEAVAH